MKHIIMIMIILMQFGYATDNYYYKNNHKVTLTPANTILRAHTNLKYYKNNQGKIVGVGNKLIVKLQDEKYLEEILNEFQLKLVTTLSRNLYLLITSEQTLTIDISNRLTEKVYVEYAHPDFVKKMMSR